MENKQIPQVVREHINNLLGSMENQIHNRCDAEIKAFREIEEKKLRKSVDAILSKSIAKRLNKLGVIIGYPKLNISVRVNKMREERDKKYNALYASVRKMMAEYELNQAIGKEADLAKLVKDVEKLVKTYA